MYKSLLFLLLTALSAAGQQPTSTLSISSGTTTNARLVRCDEQIAVGDRVYTMREYLKVYGFGATCIEDKSQPKSEIRTPQPLQVEPHQNSIGPIPINIQPPPCEVVNGRTKKIPCMVEMSSGPGAFLTIEMPEQKLAAQPCTCSKRRKGEK